MRVKVDFDGAPSYQYRQLPLTLWSSQPELQSEIRESAGHPSRVAGAQKGTILHEAEIDRVLRLVLLTPLVFEIHWTVRLVENGI